MVTAYIDESGNLADKKPYFIVAVVPVKDKRLPSRIMKRVRRVLGRRKGKIGKELKFSTSSSRVKNFFVKRLEAEKLYCFVFVVDKLGKKIEDSPENYGVVINWVLREGFSMLGWEKVVIDRKFDKEKDQKKLLSVIKSTMKTNMSKVLFGDSINEDGIKLSDFVAGFYGQFYNLEKPLPKPLKNIVSEGRVSWNLLKQKTVVPKGPDAPK